jgi:antitoxin component of MazEF toxin-antitoxin module
LKQIISLREITKLTKANTRSNSLRATIPNNIVKELGLQESDFIEWDVFEDKNEKYAKIKKIK